MFSILILDGDKLNEVSLFMRNFFQSKNSFLNLIWKNILLNVKIMKNAIYTEYTNYACHHAVHFSSKFSTKKFICYFNLNLLNNSSSQSGQHPEGSSSTSRIQWSISTRSEFTIHKVSGHISARE